MLFTSVSGVGTGGTRMGCLSVAGAACWAVENAVALGELHPHLTPSFPGGEWK